MGMLQSANNIAWLLDELGFIIMFHRMNWSDDLFT